MTAMNLDGAWKDDHDQDAWDFLSDRYGQWKM